MHVQSDEESIMISKWPEVREEWNFKESEAEIDLIKEAVRSIRNIRAEMNVVPAKKAKVFVVSNDEYVRDVFKRSEVFLRNLAYASELYVQDNKNGIDDDAVSCVIQNAVIYMPFAELVDISKEIERLTKEKEKMLKEIDRVDKKLSNQGFVSKAPQSVIDEEKAKGEKYKSMLLQIEDRLSQMSK